MYDYHFINHLVYLQRKKKIPWFSQWFGRLGEDVRLVFIETELGLLRREGRTILFVLKTVGFDEHVEEVEIVIDGDVVIVLDGVLAISGSSLKTAIDLKIPDKKAAAKLAEKIFRKMIMYDLSKKEVEKIIEEEVKEAMKAAAMKMKNSVAARTRVELEDE